MFRRDPRRGQIVFAASPLAVQDGVCAEMPISEAKSLLRHGGEFHVFEHAPESDEETIELLADSLESFSPIVGLETIADAERKRGHRPHSLLLEVTGLGHLFGDENQLACQLLKHCDTLGYLPRIAIADTVGVAWAMARYVAGPYFAQHQHPLVLPSGDSEAIQELPVASLRLEPATLDTLSQLGIETIGQLQRLPRNDLAMRFGNVIHQRLDQMTGKLEEPVIARRKPAEFISRQLLEHPTHHRETIEVIIARLVARLCEEIRARQQGAIQWTIQLVCQSGPPVEFRVNLFQPTATTAQVMPLVEMQLEQTLSPHTKKSRKQRYTTIDVNEITVSVTSSVLLAQQQRQLFDQNPRLDRPSLAHLINRLANRLGTQNVIYPSLQSGAQPEYSFRLRPLVDPGRKRRRRKTQPPKSAQTLARPFRLFQPPLRLKKGDRHILSRPPEDPLRQFAPPPFSCPVSGDTPPALLQFESTNELGPGQPKKIIAAWGPERIETGWWRGRTVCRDYWRVETESHQQLWVFCDLRSGGWFLHGEF